MKIVIANRDHDIMQPVRLSGGPSDLIKEESLEVPSVSKRAYPYNYRYSQLNKEVKQSKSDDASLRNKVRFFLLMMVHNSLSDRLKYSLNGKKLIIVILITSLIFASFVYVKGASFDPDTSYVPIATWGKFGGENGEFDKPIGIAVDSQGFVYVVDSGNHRTQKFTSTGAFVKAWGKEGNGDGEFASSYGIAIDSGGNVYVTDQKNNNVQKFNSTGGFIMKWGKAASREGFFNKPSGIVIDSEDKVYVADTDNNRIQKFDTNGKFELQWGSYGQDYGQFDQPTGIVADKNTDMLYVVDSGNKRVQVFNRSGEFLNVWDNTTYPDISSSNSIVIGLDSTGSMYVVNPATKNIIKKQGFDPYGSTLTRLNYAANTKSDSVIGGIAIDPADYIYVTDTANNMILKFGTITSTWSGFQATLNNINSRLTTLTRGSTSETLLIPASIQGTLVESDEPDSFGSTVVLGNEPSVPPTTTAKVTSLMIQNNDKKTEHKIRIQLGYQDRQDEFVVRQDLKVVLKSAGTMGDALTLPLPEPFFVPADQLRSKGTNILARIAADRANIEAEISVSVILNP